MGIQVAVPSQHASELRATINAIAKSGISWEVQPRTGDLIAGFIDPSEGMEAYRLIQSAVADHIKDSKEPSRANADVVYARSSDTTVEERHGRRVIRKPRKRAVAAKQSDG